MIIAWFFWVKGFPFLLLFCWMDTTCLMLLAQWPRASVFFFFFVFVFGYCYFVIFFFGLENCQQLQKKRNKKEFWWSLLCFFGQRFLAFYYCFAAWIIVPIWCSWLRDQIFRVWLRGKFFLPWRRILGALKLWQRPDCLLLKSGFVDWFLFLLFRSLTGHFEDLFQKESRKKHLWYPAGDGGFLDTDNALSFWTQFWNILYLWSSVKLMKMESVMSVEKAMASSTCLKLASPLQSRLANPAKCSLSGPHHLAANRKSLQGKLLSTTSPKVMVNSSSTRRSCSIRSQTVATPPTQTKQVHMQNKVLVPPRVTWTELSCSYCPEHYWTSDCFEMWIVVKFMCLFCSKVWRLLLCCIQDRLLLVDR